MNIKDFQPKMKVIYVPPHAHNDRTHKDCEEGMVSSVNDRFVFVKFQEAIKRWGWDEVTSQACKPENLLPRRT